MGQNCIIKIPYLMRKHMFDVFYCSFNGLYFSKNMYDLDWDIIIQASMLGIHNRVFNEEEPYSGSGVSGSQHNKMVLKRMMVYSPQSSIMMVIILIMFIVCELTDLVNGNYNLSVITGATLVKYGANASWLVNEGQYWRLFTAMLLHGGLLHLFSNATSFFLYLMPVEQTTKSIPLYFAVLIGGGLCGNILSLDVRNLRGLNLLAVGASTAICSVIGFDYAYRILRVNDKPLQSRRIVVSLIYLFILSLMPGVDFFGHFGSLGGGFLIGLATLKPSQTYWSSKWRKMIKLGGITVLSVYVVLLLAVLFKYKS